MTALAGLRLNRLPAATYRAFILSEGRAHPLNIGDVGDLDAAVDAAKVLCAHKDVLAIRVEEGGEAKVHVFAIRKEKPKWIHPAGEIVPRRVQTLYADPVCVLGGEVLCG